MKRSLVVFAFIMAMAMNAGAATSIWLAAGSQNWGTATNWSTGAVPDFTTDVIFSTNYPGVGTGAKTNCTANVSIACNSLTMSNYPGTLVFTTNLNNVVSNNINQCSGTITESNATIAVGTWYQYGGTLNMGASTTIFNNVTFAFNVSTATRNVGFSTVIATTNLNLQQLAGNSGTFTYNLVSIGTNSVITLPKYGIDSMYFGGTIGMNGGTLQAASGGGNNYYIYNQGNQPQPLYNLGTNTISIVSASNVDNINLFLPTTSGTNDWSALWQSFGTINGPGGSVIILTLSGGNPSQYLLFTNITNSPFGQASEVNWPAPVNYIISNSTFTVNAGTITPSGGNLYLDNSTFQLTYGGFLSFSNWVINESMLNINTLIYSYAIHPIYLSATSISLSNNSSFCIPVVPSGYGFSLQGMTNWVYDNTAKLVLVGGNVSGYQQTCAFPSATLPPVVISGPYGSFSFASALNTVSLTVTSSMAEPLYFMGYTVTASNLTINGNTVIPGSSTCIINGGTWQQAVGTIYTPSPSNTIYFNGNATCTFSNYYNVASSQPNSAVNLQNSNIIVNGAVAIIGTPGNTINLSGIGSSSPSSLVLSNPSYGWFVNASNLNVKSGILSLYGNTSGTVTGRVLTFPRPMDDM